MRIVLWVAAGIVALNVLVIATVAILPVLDRLSERRELKYLEELWRLQGRSPVGGGSPQHGGHPPRRRRPVTADSNTMQRSSISLEGVTRPRMSPRRSLGRIFLQLAVFGLLFCVGTAFASPDARQFLTSALGAVTRALGVASDADDASQRPTSPRTGTRRPTGPRKEAPSRPRARPSRHPGGGLSPATTQVGPLPSPSGVTAVAASSTEIDLTWADVTAETGYRVERSLDGSTDWTTVATTGQDLTTQSDTGLSPGTTYYYRVFATNAGGDSPASDVALAFTNPV